MSGRSRKKPVPLDIETAAWDTVRAYFNQNQGRELVKHQLESYNDFVLNKIEQIVHGFNPVEVFHKYNDEKQTYENKVYVNVRNPRLIKPTIYEKDGSTSLMTPQKARLRNFMYAGNLHVDVYVEASWWNPTTESIQEGQNTLLNVNLGKIPVMLHSDYCVLSRKDLAWEENECQNDFGGYFVINGNEKVVVSQDRISENKIYVFLDTKGSTYSHVAEIRSVPENVFGAPKLTSLKLTSKSTQFGKCIRATIHHVRQDIPVFILFRALGVETDRDIVELISYDLESADAQALIYALKGSVQDANSVMTMADAHVWLKKNLSNTCIPMHMVDNKNHCAAVLKDVLTKDFLPHVGPDFSKKALYLGHMTNKLLQCYLGAKPLDDRDSYINKRVDTPGILLANLFRQYYGKLVKDMKTQCLKDMNNTAKTRDVNYANVINLSNVHKMFKSTCIESGLRSSLSTGSWGLKTASVKQGVAQMLNRLTYVATISHLRRINTPMEKSGKLVQPRKLHNTQWGVVCPAETPEGQSVGIVKNMAITTTITIASNPESVRAYVRQFGTVMFEHNVTPMAGFHRHVRVFVNGDLVGYHENAPEFYRRMKKIKRLGVISVFTAVSWNVMESTINVSTEAGRCARPLFIVESNKLRLTAAHAEGLKSGILTWNDLVSPMGKFDPNMPSSIDDIPDTSVVEYLDVEEINSLMLAMSHEDLDKNGELGVWKNYTHMEIHPSLMLGFVASNIPFSDHNQSPRNCYQSAMAKQAIGVYSLNYQDRLDTLGHILCYPQKPLVKTQVSDILHCNDMPCGVNAIVAIMTYTGFNQEDSVMINRSALERGLFNSTFYRTYKENCAKNTSTGEEEVFCKPDATTKGLRPKNYDKLEDSGFIPENTYIEEGDVVIGKCMQQKTMKIANFRSSSVLEYKDNSIVVKNNEIGFVDKNCANNKHFRNINADGYTFAKVRTRAMRQPTIGDKVSSRHGQKGTIGIVYAQEDLPFTAEGLVPDIIVNPHAIPSRMTIGQIIEAIMGKAAAILGTYGDGTPFTKVSMDFLSNVLEENGMDPQGNETMYNPRSGEKLDAKVFIAPCFYQRLRHLVSDKVHSRATGPVTLLTRQPMEGRQCGGGLRLGEMELNALVGNGVLSFQRERFMDCSDNFMLYICRRCKVPATVNHAKGIYRCHGCKNTTNFAEVRLPFAAKLMMQEVRSMGIGMKLLTASS